MKWNVVQVSEAIPPLISDALIFLSRNAKYRDRILSLLPHSTSEFWKYNLQVPTLQLLTDKKMIPVTLKNSVSLYNISEVLWAPDTDENSSLAKDLNDAGLAPLVCLSQPPLDALVDALPCCTLLSPTSLLPHLKRFTQWKVVEAEVKHKILSYLVQGGITLIYDLSLLQNSTGDFFSWKPSNNYEYFKITTEVTKLFPSGQKNFLSVRTSDILQDFVEFPALSVVDLVLNYDPSMLSDIDTFWSWLVPEVLKSVTDEDRTQVTNRISQWSAVPTTNCM